MRWESSAGPSAVAGAVFLVVLCLAGCASRATPTAVAPSSDSATVPTTGTSAGQSTTGASGTSVNTATPPTLPAPASPAILNCTAPMNRAVTVTNALPIDSTICLPEGGQLTFKPDVPNTPINYTWPTPRISPADTLRLTQTQPSAHGPQLHFLAAHAGSAQVIINASPTVGDPGPPGLAWVFTVKITRG